MAQLGHSVFCVELLVVCEAGSEAKKSDKFSCGIELWSSLVVEHSSNLNEVQGSNLSDH